MRTILFFVLVGCSSPVTASSAATGLEPAAIPPVGAHQEAAVFAGGCFWCMESDFDGMPGVVATTSGYAGGHVVNPTYEQVVTETTGHRESVRVVYDTNVTSYSKVVDWYFHHIDPTDDGGQFCDRGESYSPAIFYADDSQKAAALGAKAAIEASHALSAPIKVAIEPLAAFYAAEQYHQDFHLLNPGRYLPYRKGCGRDAKTKAVWGG